jgi:uncharacterized protein
MPSWLVKLIQKIAIPLVTKLGEYLIKEFKKYLANREKKKLEKQKNQIRKELLNAKTDEDIMRLSARLRDLDEL